MFRRPAVRWLLLAAVLIVIGLWPAAVAPIAWASAGAAHVLAAIPGPVLLLTAVIAYLRHRPSPAPKAAV
ncbi:hypothetical protein ACH4UM_23785 [Streptomyces sp. NPDC020801]|uniref:hypothetical protein n=1 Tax=Streptomyces sp. NPDC020801 TaxID=3365093 RepID=UPI00378AE6D2